MTKRRANLQNVPPPRTEVGRAIMETIPRLFEGADLAEIERRVTERLNERIVQGKRDALWIVSWAREVYVRVGGAMLKTPKEQARSLIRSAEWANGYHVVSRRDLGVGSALLEQCGSHDECLRKMVGARVRLAKLEDDADWIEAETGYRGIRAGMLGKIVSVGEMLEVELDRNHERLMLRECEVEVIR